MNITQQLWGRLGRKGRSQKGIKQEDEHNIQPDTSNSSQHVRATL